MTQQEWNQLGLRGGFNTLYEAFMRGQLASFEIAPLDRHGRYALQAVSGEKLRHHLASFPTREEAELVSLTLRMVNPR